uniref:Uncharacterized protein n=1 Tax=Oryza barthii TaxID=65489 RepID=A0A0D3H6U8_9ORYZ
MTSSGKRADGFLRRFRRRRLLAFLRREHLYATLDALGGETRLFLNARTLQTMLADCRWEEARRYVGRFLPRRQIGVEARAVLRLIAYLSAVDDVAQGRRPGSEFAGDHLKREFEADATSSNTMVCADFVRKISRKRSSSPGRWDSVEWQFLRIQAALIVKELVINTPEFSHLLQLPRYPVNLECMMPVWFGCRRKHQRKIIGRMPASLLAHCFLPKERCPSPKKQGIPGAPVVPCIGRNCGLLSANAVTEHLSQEDCHSESVASTEHSPTTRELCPVSRSHT